MREPLGLPEDTPIVARAIPNETTRILQIRAEYGDPAVAASIANLLAENLIATETEGVVLPEGQLTLVQPAAPNPVPIAPQVSLIAIVAAAPASWQPSFSCSSSSTSATRSTRR